MVAFPQSGIETTRGEETASYYFGERAWKLLYNIGRETLMLRKFKTGKHSQAR